MDFIVIDYRDAYLVTSISDFAKESIKTFNGVYRKISILPAKGLRDL